MASNIKGHFRIELFDTISGKTKVCEGDNLILRSGFKYYIDHAREKMQYLGLGHVVFSDSRPADMRYTFIGSNTWLRRIGVSAQTYGEAVLNMPFLPRYESIATTKGCRFNKGAYAGETINCVFSSFTSSTNVDKSDDIWSIHFLNEPFVCKNDMIITLYYQISFYPDLQEWTFTLDLGVSTHSVIKKPARINENAFVKDYASRIFVKREYPELWLYTDVTSLGDITGLPNGTPILFNGYPSRSMTVVDGSLTSSLTLKPDELNDITNGISGMVIRTGQPNVFSQMKFDPPIIKTPDREITFTWNYIFGYVLTQSV